MSIISQFKYEERELLRRSLSPRQQDYLNDRLAFAAEHGERGLVQVHLSNGADPDAINSHPANLKYRGNRVIMATKFALCVRKLVEARADLLTPNDAGDTPLVWHIKNGNLNCAEAIREHLSEDLLDKLRRPALEAGTQAAYKGHFMTSEWVKECFGYPGPG